MRTVCTLVAVVALILLSGAARAYPTGPTSSVWLFVGHGSLYGGGSVLPVSGQISWGPDGPDLGAFVDLTVNGVAHAITGGAQSAYITDGPPGSDVIASGVAADTYAQSATYLNPMSSTWLNGELGFALVDQQGVAWSGLQPNPNNPSAGLPPAYAPDASLFETRTITLYQLRCDVFSGLQSCPDNGNISTVEIFDITIDSFVPEVEPGAASMLALAALASASLLARAASP